MADLNRIISASVEMDFVISPTKSWQHSDYAWNGPIRKVPARISHGFQRWNISSHKGKDFTDR